MATPRVFFLATALALVVGTPAEACRIGFDRLLFDQAPAASEQMGLPTVAEVQIIGEATEGEPDPRGFRIGRATVKRTLEGPTLPSTLPVYLGAVSSCSLFWGGHSYPFKASGYLIGRLMSDERGPYVMASEHQALSD